MKIKWFYCKWCGWDGWIHDSESTDTMAWGGCGIDANKEHQGGPHRWISKGTWNADEEPDKDLHIAK